MECSHFNLANANAGRNMEILKNLAQNVQIQQNNNSDCGTWVTIGAVILFLLFMFVLCRVVPLLCLCLKD